MERTIPKIGLSFIKDGKLLVVRKDGTDLFLMPGGQPEDGESELESLAREIEEETAGSLDIASVRHMGHFLDIAANDPGCLVQISLYEGSISGDLRPSSEIGELRWWDSSRDDPQVLSPIVRNHIVPYLRSVGRLL